MDIDTLYKDVFNEDKRLMQNKASKVEFLTTLKYIKDYLKKGDKILDVGAGTGIYSLELAKEGFDVTAFELMDHHCSIIESKKTKEMHLEVVRGNALDLSMFEDESFDLVLNFGPLYHLPKEEDRLQVIKESMRVLKPGGLAMFAYINNDMVFVTESLSYNPDFLLGDQERFYKHDSFKVVDDPFTVLTYDMAVRLFEELDLPIEKHIGTDGFSELLDGKINALNEEQFLEWLRFHFYLCEKKEFLGSSHHLLVITRKKNPS